MFRSVGCGTAVKKITFLERQVLVWLLLVSPPLQSRVRGLTPRKGAIDMIRRVVLLISLFCLANPGGIEAQRSSRSSSRVTQDSPEAEVFEGTMDAIRDYALETIGDSLLWEMAIDGLIEELGDPYATVLSPSEVAAFEEQSTGNYAGIGIAISELNAAVTITTVFGGTPAEDAGLLVGDRIVGVNSDEGDGWSVDDASSRIRGEPGTTVVVYIGRDGIAQPIPFEIERDEVHIPAVRYERIFEDISYVVLDRVTRNSAAEVDSVLTELGTTQGIVFDLRRNPGGYLDEALNLADLFLDRGSVLVTTKSRTRGSSELREESARARMTPRVADLPIVILVDQYSASAAEIVAGALQDHDRALVIGERTFGKGLVQSVIPLPEGRLIRITSGEWYTPQGRSLHRPRDEDGVVIEPDSIPEFVSIGGRRLFGGGGVFPDLEILSDTLSSGEQAFLNAAIEAEFPLQTRIQEAAFSAATGARDAGDGEESVFPVEILRDLFAAISEVEVLDPLLTEEAKRYIAWRTEVVFHQRLGQVDRGLEIQSERDTVLQTAVRFLQTAEDQTALFGLAQAEQEARAQASAEEVEAGSVPQ